MLPATGVPTHERQCCSRSAKYLGKGLSTECASAVDISRAVVRVIAYEQDAFRGLYQTVLLNV